MHPQDNRAVFIVPWEGAVLIGTTDLDHEGDLSAEPKITEQEAAYLIEGVRALFPSLDLTLNNCIGSFAGIRPVFSEGKLKPSEESREHVVWVDRGLVTVTGGKLTTFRRLALDALKAAKAFLPPGKEVDPKAPVFNDVQQTPVENCGLTPEAWRRLYGRYGKAADTLVKAANAEAIAAERERVQRGRVPHAVMLAGPAGVGKRAAARWIAMTQLGRTTAPIPEFADDIPEHADLRWVRPPEDKEAIGIDQVRELVGELDTEQLAQRAEQLYAQLDDAEPLTLMEQLGLI